MNGRAPLAEEVRIAQARQLTLLVVTAILLVLCWRMLQPFLSVVVWASVLAILFFPAHRVIRRTVKREAPAALLSVLLVAVTVIAPLVFVSSAVVGELKGMAASTQAEIERLRADPASAAALQRGLDTLRRYIDVDKLLEPDNLRALTERASQVVLARSAGIVGGLLSILTSVVFTVFTLFYLFRDGEAIARRLPGALPLERPRAEAVVRKAHEIITASVYGVLVIAILQGTLGGLMFAILGVPSALVWGVVMVLMSTIPMAGSGLVWGPAVVVLAVTGAYWKAAILVLWGVLVIGTVDNLLRPRLVGNRTGMHELFVFFSVLGGLRAFGIIGLLLGPVIVGVAFVLLAAVFGDRDGESPGQP